MKQSRKLNISVFLIFFALIPFLIFFSDFDAFAEPPHDIPPGLEIAMEVQEAYTPNLMDDPDVVGTAVGFDSTGNPVIQVFLAIEGVRGIPRTLEGINVVTRVTGELVAYMGPPPMNGGNDNDNDPTANQTPPIKWAPLVVGDLILLMAFAVEVLLGL